MNTLDKYENIKYLGKGAFGVVKLYQDKRTKEKVAIKIINKNKIINKYYEAVVKRQLNILQNIQHINIINTKQILNDSENIYIIMEYCEKGELFNLIVDEIFLKENEAAYYFYQLINGIENLHINGIVHRDLKPENLLLTKNNILKIIDFDLSNYYDKNKLLSTSCGSLGYTPPEVLYGKNYDGIMVDIWSTGIILYAMLYGFLPFDEEDIQNIYKKILKCEIKYPDNLTDDAIDLMKKILVLNPEKRISIEDIKKHRFYLRGKETFSKINPELVEEVEKKYRKINIIFNKDKINNKTIKSKNMIISHIADIKDKNKKMINLTNRYNTRKRVKKIKSVNKNNITFNENNTISSINKKKRKLKIKLYDDDKSKLLEKNSINITNSNNKKGINRNYKNNLKNSLIRNYNHRMMNFFIKKNNNNFGILNAGINSKYILGSNLYKTYNNYAKTESNTLDSYRENSKTYRNELKDEKTDKSIKKDKKLNKSLIKINNELMNYIKIHSKIKKIKINDLIKNKVKNKLKEQNNNYINKIIKSKNNDKSSKNNPFEYLFNKTMTLFPVGIHTKRSKLIHKIESYTNQRKKNLINFGEFTDKNKNKTLSKEKKPTNVQQLINFNRYFNLKSAQIRKTNKPYNNITFYNDNKVNKIAPTNKKSEIIKGKNIILLNKNNIFIKKCNANSKHKDKKAKMKNITIINNYYTIEKFPILTKNKNINDLTYNQNKDIKANKSKNSYINKYHSKMIKLANIFNLDKSINKNIFKLNNNKINKTSIKNIELYFSTLNNLNNSYELNNSKVINNFKNKNLNNTKLKFRIKESNKNKSKY